MRVAEHLVASARGRDRALLRADRPSWLWERVRRRLPDALSFVIMPDHVHVVAAPGSGPGLRRVLSAFTARFGVSLELLAPQPAHSPAIARRMVRYGFLNPVRAGLVEDAWCWAWSTLRDLHALVDPVWTRRASLASVLRLAPSDVVDALTQTQEHRPPAPCTAPVTVARFEQIVRAVAAVRRTTPDRVPRSIVGRQLVVQASFAIGDPDRARLAAALQCSDRTVRRARPQRHPALAAVMACLADPRLVGP